MSKNKDIEWYNKKMKNLKEEKRDLCSPISDVEYDTYSFEGGRVNNKHIKKLKEEFKKEKRSYKRAEKQNWRREVEDILDEYYYND